MSRTSRTHQRPLRTLIIFGVVIGLMFAIMALTKAWSPKLGLDLRGGTTITLTAKNVQGSGAVDPTSLETARSIIQQRVDAVGVGESQVTTAGDNQITVAVPNVAPDKLTEMVGQTAELEFRPVLAVAAAPRPAPQPTAEASASPSPAPTAEASPTATAAPTASAQPTATAQPSPTPTSQPSPTAAPSPTEAPGLPAPLPSPRPTKAATDLLPTDQALAYTPTKQDTDEFESYKCGDEFPDLPDQPLITCDREGMTKLLLGPTIIPGKMLTQASSGMRQGSVTWVVDLQLDDQGAQIFEKATGELAKRAEPQNTFAIVLDSKVVSFPRLSSAIPGGRAEISGSFTQETSLELANVLKFGSLPLAFDLSEVATVSPTLGGEQLRAGIIAGIIGLLLVAGYAILYYRGLSFVVVTSLIIAGLLTYASVVLLGEGMGFALNLPGIAGVIVAIGITADSFVIYFERIRDEVREGRSIRSAIETGWQGCRRTILIADAVSLLSAVVLFVLAVGGVKGFAFTLGLTTIIDLLIVFFFTKPLMTLLGRTRFYGEGRRFSGFEADHMGARRTLPAVRGARPTATKEA